MAIFLDIRFPDRISFGAIGGAGFNTNIAVMASGAESRNQEWEFERMQWEVAQAAKLPKDYQPLQAFFRLAAGRANTFCFKDWTDYICAAGDGFFIASDGSPSGYQMVKRYTFGGLTVDRRITKPRNNNTINITGVGSPSGLDYATGIVYGGTPTAWSGEFDVHCRFDTDVMRAEAINRDPGVGLIVTWGSIPIVEVKEE